MYVIRPICQADSEAFIQMAHSASIGITNMPKNPELLRQKIRHSLHNFAKEISTPQQECYLFVLEEVEKGQIGGVCGIYSKTATTAPEYFYNLESVALSRVHPAVPKEVPLLRPINERNGPSEICSLFLSHPFRKGGLGRLLSLSRFLFVASFPNRFEDTLTALMRGYFDTAGNSPFWDGIGRHFLDIDFQALLRLREEGEGFVPAIMPQYPLYLRLLSPEAQAATGQVHVNTIPALKLLQQEGFALTSQIDFFDGGPRLSAPRSAIRTIRQSCLATVSALSPALNGDLTYLICNGRLDFRATCSPLQLEAQAPDQVILPAATAAALQVKEGDKIRYVTAK